MPWYQQGKGKDKTKDMAKGTEGGKGGTNGYEAGNYRPYYPAYSSNETGQPKGG